MQQQEAIPRVLALVAVGQNQQMKQYCFKFDLDNLWFSEDAAENFSSPESKAPFGTCRVLPAIYGRCRKKHRMKLEGVCRVAEKVY